MNAGGGGSALEEFPGAIPDAAKPRIRAFLSGIRRNRDFSDEADLFTEGFLNSLFTMQLVLFLEKEFRFQVENQDLDINNFRSLNAIAALVGRKTKSAEP